MTDFKTPIEPNARLSRKSLAQALEVLGLKISPSTLASMASRGGGPRYALFCGRALYRWDEALAWAEGRLLEPRTNTSQAKT